MKSTGEIKFDKVVLDCKDPAALSDFYVKLLGWQKGYITDDFVIITADNGYIDIGFQKNEAYIPPVWPEEPGRQQQMLHLDFCMDRERLQELVQYAVSLGAKKAEMQYGDWVVLVDPAGHPFCFEGV